MKQYCKIFLMAMSMSFVCSLGADELSDRIQGLHQNLVQLRTKLNALKDGLEAISKHLRGDVVKVEEAEINIGIDYSAFSQKIKEILISLEHDISQQDGDLVKEVKVFRDSLINGNNRDALRNIDAQNIEQAIQIIKNSCTELVNSLLDRYEQVDILKVPRPLVRKYSYDHAVRWISDDTSNVSVKEVRSYTDVLKSSIENGEKQDAEILGDILPRIGWRSPGSRLAFSLLENGFYEPNFLWWATTAILWYIGQQPHGQGEQYKPSLDGALYYLLNGLSYTQFRSPLILSRDALANILLACKDYTNSKEIRFPGEAIATAIPSRKELAEDLVIDGKTYSVFFTDAGKSEYQGGRGYSLTGRQVRAEILATLYARYLMDEVMGLEQEVIRIKKRHEKEVLRKQEEERKQREEEERRQREEDRKRREEEQRKLEDERKRREEEQHRLRQEEERIRQKEEIERLAAIEEKDRKQEEERIQREEEERRQREEAERRQREEAEHRQREEEERHQREEEENLRKEEERRRQEEADRLFNESIEEIVDEIKVDEKQPVELSGLLDVIKLIAAIDSDQDIIDVASKHEDQRVQIFKFVDYLGKLFKKINANELRSNNTLKELLGYTDKIVRNILASKATLQGIFVRIQQTIELKALAELMRCLFLIKDDQIILPVGENRLAEINPVSHTLYAAKSDDPDNTNILKYYFRLIARVQNAKQEAEVFYQQYKDSVKMSFKKTLMDHLKEELDKQK